MPALTERGHEVRAPALHRGSLAADTAAVQADLDALVGHERVVVCGHSYGGAVVTGLAPRSGVELVYLAAYLLDPGETVGGLGRGAPRTALADAMRIGGDGTATLDPERTPAALYNGCAEADVAAALERIEPQALACFTAEPERFAWREVPSTYVVCTDDQAVHPDSQRQMAARATRTEEWDCGHSPMLCRPDLVVDLLTRLAG